MQNKKGPTFGVVCGGCAPKPGAYTGQKPDTFTGKQVKLGFDNTDPRDGKPRKEHMWVQVLRVAEVGEFPTGEELVGKLANDPVLQCEYQCGDTLAFKVSEIEEVYDA